MSSESLFVLQNPASSDRDSSVIPSMASLTPSSTTSHLLSSSLRLSKVPAGQWHEELVVEPSSSVMAPFNKSSHDAQLWTPRVSLNFAFSQSTHLSPSRVMPAGQVHLLLSSSTKVSMQLHPPKVSFKSLCCPQKSQAEAPMSECPPSGHLVQVSLTPVLNVFLGHASMFSRFSVGLLPAGASLHAVAPSASEYSPSPLHKVQAT
mmetsp:Transcript_13990/g.28604  ORF Transcript_13990/g.28604 Transcript_13990/m.28604 type:complete len:205 (-) Transcript_13990:298-912(-)